MSPLPAIHPNLRKQGQIGCPQYHEVTSLCHNVWSVVFISVTLKSIVPFAVIHRQTPKARTNNQPSFQRKSCEMRRKLAQEQSRNFSLYPSLPRKPLNLE